MAEGSDASEAARRWRRAGPALEAMRRRELRALTDADALAAAEALLTLPVPLPPRAELTGLVEQQRIFARLRRS
ncbi:MAG TPA: hypothetical protein VFN93_08875 [Gaiellaceae bacterium]|nr:hypothetical protein [Gaiellaceae bacterium]